jgi:ATP-dependent DNA helicase RecQ
MGYDNPSIYFVIHYQSPGSPVAYYQQVGRAGRAIDRSYGVLLSGAEETEIQDFFIRTAFPSEGDTTAVLVALAEEGGLTRTEVEARVNVPVGRLDSLLKVLEVEGAVYRADGKWYRSAQPWEYPRERVASVEAERRREQEAMRAYARTSDCLMAFLRNELDDHTDTRCGRCSNCTGSDVMSSHVPDAASWSASSFLQRCWPTIEPRRRWPSGMKGPSLKVHGLQGGRALCAWGDTERSELVRRGKYVDRVFDDALVEAMLLMIRTWSPVPAPTAVTCIPDSHGDLVLSLAQRIAAGLDLPFKSVVRRVRSTEQQKTMQNSSHQARNVRGAFAVDGPLSGVWLLVDDLVDSRWTLTEVGARLREAGAEAVYPVALADSSRGGT